MSLHRDLRLRALRDAPDCFGETFADAAARPISYWEALTRSVTEPERQVMFLACEDDDVLGSTYELLDRERSETGRVGGMWVGAPAHSPAAMALYRQAGFRETGARRPLPTNPSLQIVEMDEWRPGGMA